MTRIATGHIPTRTCLVCQTRKPKASLVRLAMDSASANIVVDSVQRLPGRGGYVCPHCLPRFRFSNRVRKAFRNRARGISEDLTVQDRARRS